MSRDKFKCTKRCKNCGRRKYKCENKKCSDCGHNRCKCNEGINQNQNVEVNVNVADCKRGPTGPTGPTGATGQGGVLAYGSLYGVNRLIPITTGQRFDFSTQGPFSGVTPDKVNDEIIVGSSGVYTIEVTFSVQSLPNDSSIFSIFINNVEDTRGRMIHLQNDTQIDNLAKIIQINLNARDAIGVEAVFVQGTVAYFNPSLVVTRIA
ncbi:hypothetical protein SAMN05428981_1089 [Bacillus sp. OV194]|nr:hypothetical protein SAMN05428981_1089 [Bacillus sp. OV194]